MPRVYSPSFTGKKNLIPLTRNSSAALMLGKSLFSLSFLNSPASPNRFIPALVSARLIHKDLANWRCDHSEPGLANSFIKIIQSCDFNIADLLNIGPMSNSIARVFAVREQRTH